MPKTGWHHAWLGQPGLWKCPCPWQAGGIRRALRSFCTQIIAGVYQASTNAKLCVKQWFKSRFLPLENSRGIVSHAVCEAAGNQKYKSSKQGLSRQMLQAHVPAKIPHLPPDQIICATGWKKIAGVGVWLHVGCLGGKKQKGAFSTEQ